MTVAPEAIERGVRALARPSVLARAAGTGAAFERGGRRRFTQVDVFTERPLLGNPLAVVHGADALDDARMQAFARGPT